MVTVALSLAGCGGDSDGGPEPSDDSEPTPAAADFELGELVTVDPLDSPEAVEKVEGEGPKVIDLLNRLYDITFVDPERWDGGEHTEMLDLFTPQARERVPEDLESLALGDLAPGLERVDPHRQDAVKVTFFVGDNLTTPIGLATVFFEATGTPADDDLEPVEIGHAANYWLTFDNGYKISAYSAALVVDGEEVAEAGEEEGE